MAITGLEKSSICETEVYKTNITGIVLEINIDVESIAKLRQSFLSFCVQKLPEKTFDCTIAINNCCLHHCNGLLFYA